MFCGLSSWLLIHFTLYEESRNIEVYLGEAVPFCVKYICLLKYNISVAVLSVGRSWIPFLFPKIWLGRNFLWKSIVPFSWFVCLLSSLAAVLPVHSLEFSLRTQIEEHSWFTISFVREIQYSILTNIAKWIWAIHLALLEFKWLNLSSVEFPLIILLKSTMSLGPTVSLALDSFSSCCLKSAFSFDPKPVFIAVWTYADIMAISLTNSAGFFYPGHCVSLLSFL